jgi:hypothetical protein
VLVYVCPCHSKSLQKQQEELLGLFTLDILTYGIELFTCRHIVGGNIDGKHFGTIVGGHCVLAEQFDAHITNDDGKTGGQYTCDWVNVQLYNDPGAGTRYTHDGDENECFGPVLDCEAALPIESKRKIRKKNIFFFTDRSQKSLN